MGLVGIHYNRQLASLELTAVPMDLGSVVTTNEMKIKLMLYCALSIICHGFAWQASRLCWTCTGKFEIIQSLDARIPQKEVNQITCMFISRRY
jgi:hypothetical protein